MTRHAVEVAAQTVRGQAEDRRTGRPRETMRLIASARVAGSRSCPRTADVTVVAPGLRMPRIDMHRCSHSITTMTPRGSRMRISASAIWVVIRSWTCGPPGEDVDQPGQLGQAGDAPVGDGM